MGFNGLIFKFKTIISNRRKIKLSHKHCFQYFLPSTSSDICCFMGFPELFSKEKFENYLNAKRSITDGKQTSAAKTKLEQFGDSIQRAKRAFIFGTE